MPEKALAWFEAAGPWVVRQPPRVDYYLRLTEPAFLGVKLREGRIELKQRTADYGLVQFGARASGRVEGWRKWSFPLAQMTGERPADADPALSELTGGQSAWLQVRKTRQTHRFQVLADREIRALPPEILPEQGCDCELTEVVVDATAWWTLGFEAYGDEALIQETHLQVAEYVLTTPNAPVLSANASYSYPEWLAKHMKSA